MYEEHFGLSRNPFQSVAEGEAVFEGPEQAKIIAGLKTALTAKDSIAVVTGPVGVGKTTIVQRALEETAPDRLVARLGRTAVASDELVDLLLAQFGVVREPTRRFECLKTFNRILNEHTESGARVFIVIEDAERLGEELLEELEALTAGDDGASAGANIVMMGPQKLDKLIAKPGLERLRQRIRLQQTLERFNAEEVEAYLRHRIAAAGGDYDGMVEKGTALMVRRCSGGIPRVINGLCETALTVTAENHMSQLTSAVVLKIATEVFGMSPGDTTPTQAPAVNPTATIPPLQPSAPRQAGDVQMPEAAAQKPVPAPKKTAPAATEPSPAAKAPAAAAPKPPPAAKPAAVAEKAESTMRVQIPRVAPRAPRPPVKPAAAPPATNGATAPAAEPKRVPNVNGPGVQGKAPVPTKPSPAKPLPELPPKFKFADEIIVDKDTKPRMAEQPRKAEPPVLSPPGPDGRAPKVPAEPAGTPPAPPVRDDIPTLGDSARVEMMAPEKPAAAAPKPAPKAARPAPVPEKPAAAAPKPAPKAARPAPAPEKPAAPSATPAPAQQEPPPTVKHKEPEFDEPTASFAKVDHDMLDAALASLAVHDAEDGADTVLETQPAVEESPPSTDIPEVTLDKAIEERRAAARAATDPAELDRMAAELEQTKSLEEMSDKLAETLFGSEELEAISLQIREEAAPEEQPVALESTEATPEAASAAAPEAPTPSADPPAAAGPPAPPKPPAAPAADAHNDMSSAATEPAPAPQARGPQPEPIENQFNTSMTATLQSLHSRPPPDDEDDDDNAGSGGLLGRLKGTFKS
jgi:general secretion pathway protein A